MLDNKQVRKDFMNYYHMNFKPNLREVCKAIKCDYTDFIKWKNGQHNFSQATLQKIVSFLTK